MNPEIIFKKLRVSSPQNKLILNAPAAFLELLIGIPFDAQIMPEKTGIYDFIIVFGIYKAELAQLTQPLAGVGKYDGLFWVAYPKGTGKIKSDLKRDMIWQVVEPLGLQCVTQIALDDTWSALRVRPVAAVGTSGMAGK